MALNLKNKIIRSQTSILNWGIFLSLAFFILALSELFTLGLAQTSFKTLGLSLAYGTLFILMLIVRFTKSPKFALSALLVALVPFALNTYHIFSTVVPRAIQLLKNSPAQGQGALFVFYAIGVGYLINCLLLYIFYRVYKSTQLIYDVKRQIIQKELPSNRD